jgi:hypothetical protein
MTFQASCWAHMRGRGMQFVVQGAEPVLVRVCLRVSPASRAGLGGIVLTLALLALAGCCEHAAPSSARECWRTRGNE